MPLLHSPFVRIWTAHGSWLECQDISWRATGWPYFHNESVRLGQAFRAVWEPIPVGPATRIIYLCTRTASEPSVFYQLWGTELVHWIGFAHLFFVLPRLLVVVTSGRWFAANSWCCVATRWGCMKKFCSFGLQVPTDMILCTSTVLILLNKLFRNFYK